MNILELSSERIKNVFSNGDIVYVGGDEDSFQNFINNHNNLNVKRASDNFISESNSMTYFYKEKEEQNVILSDGDGILNSDKYLFIISASKYERENENKLLRKGLIPFKNYIYEQWYDSFYEYVVNGKKLIVSLGWCDITCMGKYINQVKSVSKEYTCIQCLEFNFSIIHQEFNENYLNNVKKLISISDVVLCSTILSGPRLKVYKSILECAGSKCRILHIPIIDQFRGYYPQFAIDGGKHEVPYTDMEKELFYRRDSFIFSCCKRGITLNDTREIANSDHAFDNDMVESCMKFFIKLFKILDSISDIKMFDNFLNNYQTNLLFLNPGHISTFWAKKYISVIASNIIGFNVRTSEVENINIPLTDLNGFSQAPIYPQVSNKLGLKFNDSDRKYILRYDGKNVNEVSFDEYIEILYDYYKFLIKFDVTSF